MWRAAVTQPQGNKTQPPRAKKRNPAKKFVEGTGSIVPGCGSELFSGLRFIARMMFCMCFHHTYVLGYIYCQIRARELVRRDRLAQWSVRMSAHAARAGSNPGVHMITILP